MKKYLITFLLCLSSIISFGQKKVVYLNDDLVEIPKSIFEKEFDYSKFYKINFDLDTLNVNIIVQRERKGKINNEKRESIRESLSKTIKQNIPKNNTLVINYYPGEDKCNSTIGVEYVSNRYEKYTKNIQKQENLTQIYIYRTLKGAKNFGRTLKWFPDEEHLLEKTFFRVHYPCDSFVLIDEKGNYYIQKGEYNIDDVLPLLMNKEDTFSGYEK